VLIGVGLLALVSLLACVHSAAPPASHLRAKAIRAMPLVDRMYAEIDFPGIDDPKTTLSEALHNLAQEYGLIIEVKQRAFGLEEVPDVLKTEVANPNPLPPVRERLGLVLDRMLARIPVASGAMWLLRDDHIEITTGQFVEAETTGKRLIDSDEEREWGRVLPWSLVNADLRKKPLAEGLDVLAERTGRMVVLDESLTKEFADRPVTAKLRNVHLDTAVLLLASQADLALVKMDNVLYVTTEEKAARLAKRYRDLRAATTEPPKKPAVRLDRPLIEGFGGTGNSILKK